MSDGWTVPEFVGRRRHYRTYLDSPLPAVLTWLDTDFSEDIGITDISEGGCAVTRHRDSLPAHQPMGTVRIEVTFPGEVENMPATATAMVRNAKDLRMGLEFVDSDDAPLDAFRPRVIAFVQEEQRRQLAKRAGL